MGGECQGWLVNGASFVVRGRMSGGGRRMSYLNTLHCETFPSKEILSSRL